MKKSFVNTSWYHGIQDPSFCRGVSIWIIPTVYEPYSRRHWIWISWRGGLATIINGKRFTEIILHACISTYSKIYKYNYFAEEPCRCQPEAVCLSRPSLSFHFPYVIIRSFSVFYFNPKVIENFLLLFLHRSSQGALHTIQAAGIHILLFSHLIHGSSHGNRSLQSQMPLCFFSATQKLKGRIDISLFFGIPLRKCG